MRSKRRWLRLLFIPFYVFIFLFGISVGIVEATDGIRGTRCTVNADEYIDHDFYFLCRTLVIRGTVDGDLIGLASEVTIDREGVVMGDIWVIGGQLTVNGTVGDDLHFAGADLDITEQSNFTNSHIDVAAVSLSLELSRGAEIPGDILMIGYQALVYGNVGGNIDFQGQSLDIKGSIGGDVDAIVGDARAEIRLRSISFLPYSIRLRDYGLYVGDEAYIEGNLRYEAAQQSNIPRNAVQQTTRYKQVFTRDNITRAQQPRTFLSILKNYFVQAAKDAISLLLVGALVLQFTPTLVIKPSERVRQSPLPAVSWGLILSILFTPVIILEIFASVILVILITFITLSALTLPTSLFLIVINLIFIFSFYFLLFYLGRVITCYLIGNTIIHSVRYYLTKRHHDPDDPPIYIYPIYARHRWIVLALGAMIYGLLVNMPLPSPVPTLSLIFEAVVALSGLGAIFMLGRDTWDKFRDSKRTMMPLRGRPKVEDIELPADSDTPLGMENLPEGFEGFHD